MIYTSTSASPIKYDEHDLKKAIIKLREILGISVCQKCYHPRHIETKGYWRCQKCTPKLTDEEYAHRLLEELEKKLDKEFDLFTDGLIGYDPLKYNFIGDSRIIRSIDGL